MVNIDFIFKAFLHVWNISWVTSPLIAFVLLLSPVFDKKYTVSWRYLVWIVFAVRLVLPVDVSGFGWKTMIQIPGIVETENRRMTGGTGQGEVDLGEQQGVGQREEERNFLKTVPAPKDEQQIETERPKTSSIQKEGKKGGQLQEKRFSMRSFFKERILPGAAVLWIAGAVCLVFWQFACYVIFLRKLKKSKEYFTLKEEIPVYISSEVSSPMLLGIRKPQIILPPGEYSGEELAFILDHESAHHKRKDLIFKLLLRAARTIHWFNPFVALMERRAVKDIELLCDSFVVKNYSKIEKKQYSETLLACAGAGNCRHHFLCASEFSRDAESLKERFSNIFSSPRKKGVFAGILGIGMVLFVSIFVSVSTPDSNGSSFLGKRRQSLSLIVSGSGRKETGILPKSLELPEKQEEDISNLHWTDWRRVKGKEFLHKDEQGWSYYLEEDENKESPAWEFARALEPLLLARYKGEERQVLENMMFQDFQRDCPVLFAGGRIIYRAAPTKDLAGVKESMLVSIAMDGSDRKTADTILYHVFDSLCEDDGWIYYTGWAEGFPKPLCRISPDFSSGPQFVAELPGILCGVLDHYVFYLAAKGEDAGIWKRNLDGGEDQIHDKWGLGAEDIQDINVREKNFLPGELYDEAVPGCNILYDSGEGTCSSDIPFYLE